MSNKTVKSRNLPFKLDSARMTIFDWDLQRNFFANANELTANGIQITESVGHRLPHGKPRIKDGDVGGDFFTQSRRIVGSSDPMHLSYSSAAFRSDYYGTVQWQPLDPRNGTFPPPAASSDAQLAAFGATAIARCKPTKSTASLSVALGELYKDGLPRLVGIGSWRDRTSKARQVPGDEYLNVQFGWKPLVHDINSTADGVLNAHALVNQYVRDAGRPVSRDYRFPTERSHGQKVLWGNGTEYIDPFNSRLDSGSLKPTYYTDSTTVDRWFEGVFTYALPRGIKDVMGKHVSAASKVLGIELTPSTAWELAPWSWAADWFSNTGDVVSNLSDWANDGLVLRYGYIMEHSIATRTYFTEGTRYLPWANSSPPPLTFITETKLRKRANPFGFGLNWDSLTSSQLAIAAALGISRS